MINCPNCSADNPLMNNLCSCCGNFLGFPNVNDCMQKNELDTLQKKYFDKVEIARQKGHDDRRLEFEEKVRHSRAVVNSTLIFIHYLMVTKNSMASNYQLGVDAEMRESALVEFDKERRGIEGTLFGGYGKDIRYAALSLDGAGLKSYGDFTLVLSQKAVELRATLLEENSYRFVKRHNILAGDKIPPGHRAVWKDRHKLAVAKLDDKEMSLLAKGDKYEKIILKSTGDRNKDEFIEVHIYGTYNSEAVEAVRGNTDMDSPEKYKISELKDYLERSGREWIEE